MQSVSCPVQSSTNVCDQGINQHFIPGHRAPTLDILSAQNFGSREQNLLVRFSAEGYVQVLYVISLGEPWRDHVSGLSSILSDSSHGDSQVRLHSFHMELGVPIQSSGRRQHCESWVLGFLIGSKC